MIIERPDPDSLLANLRDRAYDVTAGIELHELGHDTGHGSVRRFVHAGHDIEIHTHYRIVIDGQDFPDPLHVAADGTVHYHGYPQYRSPSAVDVVKRIAEDFLDYTPPRVDAEPIAKDS